MYQQGYNISKLRREQKNGHRAFVLWFTGLSGAGKSTLASLVQDSLFAKGTNVYVLDGDDVRMGLSKDLGFSKEDRSENIRRVAEVARLFCNAGMVTITAFISPYEEDRLIAKEIIGKENFVEVFVNAPLETCKQRDVKGLYKKAADGLIKSFTGIDDVYEVPAHPDIMLDTQTDNPETSLSKLIGWLENRALI